MTVSIRVATGADAEGLAAVNVSAWQAGYADLLPADFLAGLDVSARAGRWREVLADGSATTLAATSLARIIGYVAVGRDAESGDPRAGWLYAIYVDPAHWGRGVGHLLHESGLQTLREQECTTVGLWVLRENLRAIRFYAAHGWQPNGREQIDSHLAGIELDEIGYSRGLGNSLGPPARARAGKPG